MDVPRAGNGQIQKGRSLNPATQFKPGESGNPRGTRHRAKCQQLIENHNLDEEMALIAARQGRYKRVPYRDQIEAYRQLRDAAYGKPATVQVANVGEVQYVKVIGGVDQDLV
jgi:hypothetical protein